MSNETSQSQSTIKLFTALMNFQSECPTIAKQKKGYGYNYAEMSKTIEVIKPILNKHGIGFTQLIENESQLTTIIFHAESGEIIKSSFQMPQGTELKGMNLFQTDGAKFTYYKRYQLLSLLGVFSEDEDIDAKGQVKKAEPKKDVKRKLNEQQFIQLIGALNSGQYTKEDSLKTFDLTEQQIKTINEL
jgi:hypothetical protein